MSLKTTLFTVICLASLAKLSYAGDHTVLTDVSTHLPAVDAGISPPLIDIPQTTTGHIRGGAYIVPLHKREAGLSTGKLSAKQAPDPLLSTQLDAALTAAPAPIISFDGLSGKDNAAIFGGPSSPSDANGDVGIDHYVQMVNTLYQVFDKKTGLALTEPTRLSSLFAAAGKTGPCAKLDQGDPVVLYDALANRWLLSQFSYTSNGKPPYHECVAISQTGDPTGGYYVYDFIIPHKKFGDYPKFGVWPDGYYMTAVQFSGDTFSGMAVFAFDRSRMLQGLPAAANYHNLARLSTLGILLPADVDGPAPPLGTPNYVVGFDTNFNTGLPTTKLRVFEVKADFTDSGTGSIKERTPLTVAAFNPSVCRNANFTCIIQPPGLNGVNQKLDALFDRPMYRLQYRYFDPACPMDNTASACATLVFNHTVRGSAASQAAIRWYIAKHNIATDKLSIAQQGSFAPDTHSRWMGSAALNKQGDLALGYSISSTSLYPSIGYAGRLVSDAANTLTLDGMLKTGGGTQTGDSERWGDYSSMSVDPEDDCTFWYTNQYYANNRNGVNWLWRTRIGRFRLSDTCH